MAKRVFNAVNDIHGKMHILMMQTTITTYSNGDTCTHMHNNNNKAEKKGYLRFRRPSRTLYTKSWNAKSTGGRVGRCDNVFGCVGTICNLIAPLFLSFSIKFSLTQSPSTILAVVVLFCFCLVSKTGLFSQPQNRYKFIWFFFFLLFKFESWMNSRFIFVIFPSTKLFHSMCG